MSDKNSKNAFDFLADDADALPPTSVTHLRQAGIRTRVFRTALTCSLVIAGLAVILPLLPDTDSRPAVAVTQTTAQAQMGDHVADAAKETSEAVAGTVYREDVVYRHQAAHYSRQRI